MTLKFIPQHDKMDCGPSCLAMVAGYFGKKYSLQYLRENSFITREGVSLLGISEAAANIGFDTVSAKLTVDELIEKIDNFPCILHWNKNHFVVLYKITSNILTKKRVFHIADPSYGMMKLNEVNFKNSWLSDGNEGVALFLFVGDEFLEKLPEIEKDISFTRVLTFIQPYKKQLSWMFVLIFFGSILNLIFPFLTQYLIDRGVVQKDLNIITVILVAQLAVFLGTLSIEVIRNWIMLYVGTKISINIISDFLKKLLQLPIKFFETKLSGDFNQRIQDNERIENFLTSQSLLTFFSVITFTVFFGVLWYYNIKILAVYLLLTIISIFWSFYWLKARKILDYFKFQYRSENQESIYEIINSVTEIKLNHFETFKLREWEKIQQKLFKINIRSLKIDQIQLSGFEFINQVKNIVVTFMAATFVVKGSMTLGELLSVSYIVGQMNSPVAQLISFFRSLQDAKLSLVRLNEVQDHPAEEQRSHKQLQINGNQTGISFENVCFQYEGPRSPFVLQNISFMIPAGKVTAIVGASGSGKTTLMKLLLKFYKASSGNIYYGNEDVDGISPHSIRKHCGVVMQDGIIFSDTIERNIATGDNNIDTAKLHHAVKIANIEEFVQNLPLGFNTKIGASGNGISGGQKQRILIARAVYKNPHFIFFDEATSALDAENEKIIHDNLQEVFKGKTALIVAHRLSTVKNADQIIVLNKGIISEIGIHSELVDNRGDYFKLIKNQLELGN